MKKQLITVAEYTPRIRYYFGGITKVEAYLKRIDFKKFVEEFFPERVGKHAKYTYFDALCSHYFSLLNEKNRIRQLKELSKSTFDSSYFNKSMSRYTFSRLIKSLAIANHIVLTDYTKEKKKKNKKDPKEKRITFQKIVRNQVNLNKNFNDMLIAALLRYGSLKKGGTYNMYIDTTFIYSKNSDAKIGYVKATGYNPIVAFLGGMPVYFEGRNGNSVPRFHVQEALNAAIKHVESYGFKIDHICIDNAGFNLDLMTDLHQQGRIFYIRQSATAKNTARVVEIKEAKGRFPIQLFETWRQVYTQKYSTKENKDEMKLFCVATNDRKSTKKEVIEAYNQRAICEGSFKELKNDFNWHATPFIKMKENFVYYNICALFFILYKSMMKEFEQIAGANGCRGLIKSKMEKKTFCDSFIRIITDPIKIDCHQLELDDGLTRKFFKALDIILQRTRAEWVMEILE